jgi:glycosyltransferase involved in cell wall biosynthesis
VLVPASPKAIHIAWIGAGPGEGETGGVAGVATELLSGLATIGHRIHVFLPAQVRPVSAELDRSDRIYFVWGTSQWRWNRWYSKAQGAAWLSGLAARSLSSLRLRRQVARVHRSDPFDVVYQFCDIETLMLPLRLRRTVPLVVHPEIHTYGELRCFLAEWRLSRRCQTLGTFLVAAGVMAFRALVQRLSIRHASLIVCISPVFCDHLVRDYGVSAQNCVVVPNPVRLQRFANVTRTLAEPPTVLVLGAITVRKGIDDVVLVAHALLERSVAARVRVVGGPRLRSDYTRLLDDLPPENSEYVGSVPASQVPVELSKSDILLQASRYEPFALTVAEALAARVPVVATTEVGALAGVDRSVVTEVEPGDVEGMVTAITSMLANAASDRERLEHRARAEAERLFSPDVVCAEIAWALDDLLSTERPKARAPSLNA